MTKTIRRHIKPTPHSPDPRITEYTFLTDDKKALIYHLAQAQHSQGDISRIVGCTQATVCRWLSRLHSTVPVAKARLQNSALAVTEAAIEGSILQARIGQPESALEVLDRTEVLPKRQTETGRGSQVNIVIGMPGKPISDELAIDVSKALSPETSNELP